MNSLLSDISATTGIPKLTLEKLADKSCLILADSVLENIMLKSSQSAIDIGIGVLNIKIEDSQIKYKFIPSKELDKLVVNAVNSKTSPLISKLDLTLNERISATYKELL